MSLECHFLITYFTIVVINLIILSSSLSVSLFIFIFLCLSLSPSVALSLSLSVSLTLFSLLFSSVLQTCVAFRLVIIRNITGSSSGRLPSAPPGCPSSTSVENICVSTGAQFEFYLFEKKRETDWKKFFRFVEKKSFVVCSIIIFFFFF